MQRVVDPQSLISNGKTSNSIPAKSFFPARIQILSYGPNRDAYSVTL